MSSIPPFGNNACGPRRRPSAPPPLQCTKWIVCIASSRAVAASAADSAELSSFSNGGWCTKRTLNDSSQPTRSNIRSLVYMPNSVTQWVGICVVRRQESIAFTDVNDLPVHSWTSGPESVRRTSRRGTTIEHSFSSLENSMETHHNFISTSRLRKR